MNQTYTHEFQCEYDFKWYPFDTQVREDPFEMCWFNTFQQ